LILWNKSRIRIFWKHVYKMNPRNKSLRFGLANLPAWIRKDSFRAIVLRICQDSWGFVGFVKTGRIFGSSGHKTNPRFESLRIARESGFPNLWSWIRQSRNETNLFGVRIRDYNTKQIHGFAKRIHVFTNLLYDSRILKLLYSNI
jgi:hypothetical protein